MGRAEGSTPLFCLLSLVGLAEDFVADPNAELVRLIPDDGVV